jgi:hypothetical protein
MQPSQRESKPIFIVGSIKMKIKQVMKIQLGFKNIFNIISKNVVKDYSV